MTRSGQRGFTLLEALLAVAAVAAVTLALGAQSLSAKPGTVAGSAAALPAVIARARALAEASGDGATLSFVPSATGLAVTLYPHRPMPGSDFSATRVERVEYFAAFVASSIGGAAPFAIFISSSGGASWAAWTPASGTLAAEPACTEALGLVLAPSAEAAAAAPPFVPARPAEGLRWFTLACEDATLQS